VIGCVVGRLLDGHQNGHHEPLLPILVEPAR
jgi:hypothetical protein